MGTLFSVFTWFVRIIWIALAPATIIGTRQDVFDTRAFFGWTWFELTVVCLAIASVFVFIELYSRNWHLEHSRPKFRVRMRVSRLHDQGARFTVLNVGRRAARVNCRVIIEQKRNDIARHYTEPYIACWEESADQYLDIASGDIGTLYAGHLGDAGDSHAFLASSYRYGERHEFACMRHNTEFKASLIIIVFSEPSPSGKREWEFEFGDVHRNNGVSHFMSDRNYSALQRCKRYLSNTWQRARRLKVLGR